MTARAHRWILASGLAVVALTACGRQTAPPKPDVPLWEAAKKGDVAAVERLLKGGANLEGRDPYGQTPLMLAADNGDTTMVKLLLDHGARPDSPETRGLEPLALAAAGNYPEAVRLLLEKGANVEAKDQNGWTALVRAAGGMSDTTPTMKLLIAHGATQEDKVQALFAVAEQVAAVIEAAPEKGPNPAQKQRELGQSLTPWGMDSVKKVELLLASGVNVNARDRTRDNATPLIWASAFGNTDVVRLLLNRGARVDATDSDGATALIAAACNCAIIDMPDTTDSMRLLLAKGAKVEAHDYGGSTALTSAAAWGRTANVKLVLEHGAQIEDRDKRGNTALMISARGGALPTAETVKFLLEKGADSAARDEDGNTPLILAASGGGYEDAQVVALLLQYGADPRATNDHGDTALTLAQKKRRTAVARLLKKATADPAQLAPPARE